MPLVTLVQQSSTGTTAFNNTYPDPVNKMGNKWSQSGSGLTRSSSGGIVGSNNSPLAYRVDTPSQRVSATGVRGLTNGNYYVILHSNRTSASDDSSSGSGYLFYLRSAEQPGIFKIENGNPTRVASISTAGTWYSNTLTSVVLDCTIPGTVTASITYGGNTYSTSYSDPYPLQGNWASYQIWDNGGGGAQTATSLVIETLSVATVPLSIGTRSSSTVTVSTQESIAVDGHSYAYRVTLTATSTVTNVGDKLVTGANSYVITAVTGTTLTVVGDPFSTTAAPGTGSATTQRSFSTVKSWADASPNLGTKDWIWKGLMFKEGSGTNGEWSWNSGNVGATSTGSDAARYYWLTAAPGQSFRDNFSAGSPLAYNTASGVSINLTDEYTQIIGYTPNPRTVLSGLQIRRSPGIGGIIMSSGVGVIYDSCILDLQNAVFHNSTTVNNCLVTKSGGSLTNEYLGYYSKFRNSTFIGPGSDYAFKFHDTYAAGNVIKNCAVFNWNTFTSNITKIDQIRSSNNATNLSTIGWSNTGTVVNLTTSSQFNNSSATAPDYRIREYSSLINNGTRDQQYTGDVDIIGRPRSTTAPTIGAWEYLSNRLVTGIQSRNQYGAVVDMGSYYVSKDYGLDVYPNLVPGRTSPGLYSWGYNLYGYLGDNTTAVRSSPVQVGSLTNWRQVSAWLHTMAIKTDGTLWAWGQNDYGQLGLGNNVNYSSPIQVGTDNKWKIVVASTTPFASTAAIKTDGTLWTWGNNGNGQLGLGNTVNYNSPMQVGSDNKWKIVSMSAQSLAAIKTDGTLWTWGLNSNGGLGLGDRTDRSSPTEVGGNYWASVSLGNRRMTAIRTNGTMWTCGYNSGDGELGIGTTERYSSPVQIGSLNDWKQVSSAEYSTLCIKTNGTLWAWGYSGIGQLGNGLRTSYRSPIQIGSLSNWKSVSFAGFSDGAAMAIKTDGTLWAWGANSYGGLGLGNAVDYSSPVQVGSLTTWKSASPGYYHTAAISDGQV